MDPTPTAADTAAETQVWPAARYHRGEPEAEPGPLHELVPGVPARDDRGFAVVMRGYDRGQVDAEMARLHELLAAAEQSAQTAAARSADFERRLQETTRELVAARRGAEPSPLYEGLGSRIEEMLRLAADGAREIVERAHQDAERTAAEARVSRDQEAAAARSGLEDVTRRREAVLADLRRLREMLGAAEGDAVTGLGSGLAP